MENKEFSKMVNLEMAEFADRGMKQKGDQFAVWFINMILGEDEGDAIEQYHIGSKGDNKLDIGILDEEHTAVIIGQCKFSDTPLTTTFGANLPEEAKNGRDRLKTVPDAGNEKRKDFAQRFARTEKPVRILAVGFGNFSPDAYKYAAANKIEIYDFEKIKRRYIYNQVMEQCHEPDSVTFAVKPDSIIAQEITVMGLRQFVFPLNVTEIYKLVKEYKDGIFQMNMRFRLEKSAKSGIGKEIYDTILGKDATAFSILNNGLTLVAKRVEQKKEQVSVISPQIINGCQTCWAIYDAVDQLNNTGEDIEKLSTNVLVKLVETQEDKFIERITITTNKQNPISAVDLHSKDECQIAIAKAFKDHKPPIFYDFRAGLWESIVRENLQSTYRISGKKYRKVNNTEIGQLYLALLEKPYWSKQFKRKIFEDSDYYEVIFRYDLDRSERFANDTLGLTPGEVHVYSGLSNFVEDVLFAYGIYQLADGLKQLYRKKVAMYPEEKLGRLEKAAYDLLIEQRKFFTNWHFLLIALMHQVLTYWAKRGEDQSSLRKKLIGDDWDLIFSRRLEDEFTLNVDLENASILDEDHPTDKFKLFSVWANVLIDKVGQTINGWRAKPEFSFRWFIDQRDDTFIELKRWIDNEYVKGKHQWDKTFPRKE